jgi:hypothetical protein
VTHHDFVTFRPPDVQPYGSVRSRVAATLRQSVMCPVGRGNAMNGFLTAVLVAAAAAVLERVVVGLARALWGALRPAA